VESTPYLDSGAPSTSKKISKKLYRLRSKSLNVSTFSEYSEKQKKQEKKRNCCCKTKESKSKREEELMLRCANKLNRTFSKKQRRIDYLWEIARTFSFSLLTSSSLQKRLILTKFQENFEREANKEKTLKKKSKRRRGPKCLIKYNGDFYHKWAFLVNLATIVSLTIYPLAAGKGFEAELLHRFCSIDYIIDIILLFDIALTFVSEYVDDVALKEYVF